MTTVEVKHNSYKMEYKSFKDYVDSNPFGVQKWIARKTGISAMTISRIYTGRNRPTLPTVLKICEVTGLTPDLFDLVK